MQGQRIAPPPARRRPGAPGQPKPGRSTARTQIAIESNQKATYHSSMTTSPMSPAVAEARHGQVLRVPEAGHYPQSQRPDVTTPAMIRLADTVNNRA
jgi:hypothetical protein